jgi:hypothetical protein
VASSANDPDRLHNTKKTTEEQIMAKRTKKQYRVVYEIDVVANSEVEAAIQAYESMIDPESMAPCLEVILWHGETPPAAELRGIVVDVDEQL